MTDGLELHPTTEHLIEDVVRSALCILENNRTVSEVSIKVMTQNGREEEFTMTVNRTALEEDDE